MLVFRYVRWKNLLSTGNYFTEIKLDNTSNTLVVGENGSGKSTMLDALCFGLFGKPFRSIVKPNLINSINGKDTVVEVEFNAGNKSYKIIRGIKPNIFEIYQDGELLNQDAAARDYQEYLEKFILKMNYKSFTQIVILGSASFTPFMQLSNTDRRAIIEDLLDIQIFSTMNGLVKEKLSNNKDLSVAKKHEIDIDQQKYELKETHIKQLKQNNDEKIDEYELDIANNSNHIVTLETQTSEHTDKIDTLQADVTSRLDTEQKVKKFNQLETQIETNLSKYKKDVNFFEHNDNCPTCRQTIDKHFKEEEIGNLTNKITECTVGLSQLEIKLLEEQNKLNEISEKQKQIQELQIKIATNTTSITEIKKYIVRIEKHIDELKNTKDISDTEQKQLEELKVKIDEAEKELKELIDEKTYYEVASGLLKDTGIKTKIIKQYLPIINKLVNKYLASLDFFVNFNLDESFKETIKSRHRDEFTYNNFSEGEKQRIDMALMLTWRAVAKLKNSSNTNLLILDEIFDSSLDVNGTDELIKILHMLEDVNLFVISHKGDILQDKFNHVIKFEKIKNFSRIVK
jgi:DNA repair exonuclease SbcCD ATPase subunit